MVHLLLYLLFSSCLEQQQSVIVLSWIKIFGIIESDKLICQKLKLVNS